MTETPRRPLVTLSHLNRASAMVIALQLAFGATVAILLYCAGRWLIVGGAFIGTSDGQEKAWMDIGVLAVMLVGLFAYNLVGLFIFRVLSYLWRRLRPAHDA